MRANLRTIGKIARFSLLGLWVAVIVFAIACYTASPRNFSASNIAGFILTFQTEVWLIYLVMSAVRGFTLLPSTPLVLAGTFLYPDRPLLVLSISMAGILVSSSLIYFFSEA